MKVVEISEEFPPDYSLKLPKYLCKFELILGVPDAITINLTKWPSRWYRFWTRIFFGWKFEAVQ